MLIGDDERRGRAHYVDLKRAMPDMLKSCALRRKKRAVIIVLVMGYVYSLFSCNVCLCVSCLYSLIINVSQYIVLILLLSNEKVTGRLHLVSRDNRTVPR